MGQESPARPGDVATSTSGLWIDLALLAMARVAASAVVLFMGFDALSDDDYARTVIAERFAHAPSLDPSTTSWLPLPFWITGSAMVVLGPSVVVARGTAIAAGVFATWCVYVAAGWLGARRAGQLGAGVLACAMPYLGRLGAATVPELPTAALILLGACALVARPTSENGPLVATLPSGQDPATPGFDEARRRWIGATALFAACLSRYEAWPTALAFAGFVVWEAARTRRLRGMAELVHAASFPATWRLRRALPAVVAALGPLLWLLHGAVRHGDAFFFAERVASYRRALGPESVSLLPYVRGIAWEPALFIAAAAVLVATRRHQRDALRPLTRPALVLGALVVSLELGQLAGGAPTHHAERAVAAIWLFECAAIFAVWSALTVEPRELRRALAQGAVAGAVVQVAIARLAFLPPTTTHRSAEVELGEIARSAVSPGGTLLVETSDYGYFAVIAGFGNPDRAIAVASRDPRADEGPPKTLSEIRALLPASAEPAWIAAPSARLAELKIPAISGTSEGEFALGAVRIHE